MKEVDFFVKLSLLNDLNAELGNALTYDPYHIIKTSLKEVFESDLSLFYDEISITYFHKQKNGKI